MYHVGGSMAPKGTWNLDYSDQGTTFSSVATLNGNYFAGAYQKRNPEEYRAVLVNSGYGVKTTATAEPAKNAPSPSSSDSPKNNNGCFSADDMVTTKDGSKKSLADLHVGEEILTLNAKGVLEFSPVVFLPRESPNYISASFIKITTADGESIHMTPDHLVAFEEYCEEGNASANAVDATMLRRADQVHRSGCLYISSSDNKSLILKRVAEIEHMEKEGIYTAVAMNPYLVRIYAALVIPAVTKEDIENGHG
jgi:Hint module